MKVDKSKLVFFLGGKDLEMETIKGLLEEKAVSYYDKGLSWGAKASAYKQEIENTICIGLTPVLVELDNDISLSNEICIFIDHHGEDINRPSAIRQVFELLQLPEEEWTRYFQLVSANDVGHIQGLMDIGATEEEILAIRKAEWRAQGITDEQMEQSKIAIKNLETTSNGKLTIVRLPHSKTAVVTDLLHPALGGPGYENLVVISLDEVNFYGTGDLVMALDRAFPGGWYGGALPKYGFWGHSKPLPDVVEFLKRNL